MSEHSPKYGFTELVLLALQGDITLEQMERLNSALSTDPAKIQVYVELLEIYSELSSSGSVEVSPRVSDSAEEYNTFLRVLADEESTAPECELLPESLGQEIIQKVIYPPREKRPISKFSIFMLLNAAAILLFFIFIQILPPKGGIEVATLTDSMNPQWADAASMVKGSRIAAGGGPFVLHEGLIELEFDNQANVILEGPAKFRILAEDRIGLEYGKLYAVVPKGAIGFSVYAQQVKIIDMGTEFGVQAEFNGDTQLHVMKGKTILMAGGKADTGGIEVGKGSARRISGETQMVTDIPCQTTHFIRAFDSVHKVVWREQPSLDLADIVRNGNGLGTGNSHMRLNHEKGFTTEIRWGHTSTFKDYLLIKDHPFIDGIFIPNGKTVVSSQGDVFEGFMNTNGIYCADLFATPDPGHFVIDDQVRTIQFDGQEYSERGKSCIVMQHSNHGITFDLHAIRDRYKLKVDQFTSRVGVIEFDNKRCNANFYVLVDGQMRYSLLGYTQKGVLNDVSVKLEDTDRFLTLATTENVDQVDFMANSTLYENWCVFTEPVLVLE